MASRPDPRRAELDVRPRPGRRGPGARHRTAAGGVLQRGPRLRRGITVPAIVDVPTGAGGHQRLRADDAGPVAPSGRPTTAPARPSCTRRRCARDRRGQRRWSTRRQQRRVPVRFRRLAGGLREGVRPAVRPAGLADRPAGHPAVPGRRHHHRGRHAAVHHAGPLRPGLPRPLQVQPAEADRDAGAVGVRAGPVPDPGFGDTIDFDHIKRHYYRCHRASTRPGSCHRAGPGGWQTPHRREALGGRPFGDGTPPARRPLRSGWTDGPGS